MDGTDAHLARADLRRVAAELAAELRGAPAILAELAGAERELTTRRDAAADAPGLRAAVARADHAVLRATTWVNEGTDPGPRVVTAAAPMRASEAAAAAARWRADLALVRAAAALLGHDLGDDDVRVLLNKARARRDEGSG